jgi:hypothetical protein
MKKTLVASALGALALAAPAFGADGPPGQALSPEIVPGAGLSGVAGASYTIVRHAAGQGLVGTASFRLTPGRVDYRAAGIRFRSLKVGTVVFGLNAVKLHGTGLLDGRRVSFTAVGVHNAKPGIDVFRLAWNHGAAVGGIVTSGSVFIR